MARKTNTVVLVVVMTLVILFGVGQFFAFSNLPPAPANPGGTTGVITDVIRYVPSGNIYLAQEKGSCFASSISAPYRTDAWRCTVGNAIADPCFAIPGSLNKLLCRPDPTGINASSSFILNLVQALPKAETPKPIPLNWSWLIQLHNGDVCAPFTGTLPFTADHVPAYYGCSSASGRAGDHVILGEITASTSTAWTVEEAVLRATTSSLPVVVSSTTVTISTAWE
jgi:hypothetical protein